MPVNGGRGGEFNEQAGRDLASGELWKCSHMAATTLVSTTTPQIQAQEGQKVTCL